MIKKINKHYIWAFIILSLINFMPFTYGKYINEYSSQIVMNARQPKYYIRFNANGGTGTMEDQEFFYSESQKLTKNTFTKTNYLLDSWNTEVDGSGTSYEDQQLVGNLSTVDDDIITLYAQWIPNNNAAKIGNKYYKTLQLAIDDVTTSNPTTIVLLKDVSEIITVSEGQNITFNLQEYTLRNSGNNAAITNDGILNIYNGTISSTAPSTGAINNNEKGVINISGGKVELVGSGARQALYNKGTAIISGDAYLSSVGTARAAVQNVAGGNMTIASGTIISTGSHAVNNAGNLTIGIKNDGNMDITTPLLQGVDNGLYTTSNFNMYDGIIKGKNKAVSNMSKLKECEEGYNLGTFNETIDGVVYKTAHLGNSVIISLDLNGGILDDTQIARQEGQIIGSLPEPVKSGHIFNGWYDAKTDGNLIDENYIVTDNMYLYAHWTKTSDVAKIGNTLYDTLQEAINAAPSNTNTTITLLKDISEIVTVGSSKKIILDLDDKTITNCSNNAIITNEGNLTILNGNIASSAEFAAIDNNAGNLVIDGTRITATGSKQSVYVVTGVVEIKGDAYLSSKATGKPTGSNMERGTIQNLIGGTVIISSGTIIGEKQQAVSNEGILIIGTDDEIISITNPVLIGEVHGVRTTGTFTFFDGIIKGRSDAIDGSATYSDDLEVVDGTEHIGSKTYKTAHLESK